MLPSVALSVILSGVAALGQSTSISSKTPSRTTQDSPTATVTDTATTHTIAVGASGHKFTPGETKAKVGDTIEFKFYPVAHWVIRGDFNYPCIPYEYVGTDRRGFSSGEQTVQAITDDGPKFQVRVNDTAPIYFYCGAPGSCVRYHMMGVVNPTKNGTLDDWQNNAKGVDFQLRPGEPWPSEGDHPTEGPTSIPKPPANGGNDDQEDGNAGKEGLGAGAIAGIVIGAVIGVILLALILFFCLRRRVFAITREKEAPTVVNFVPNKPLPGPLPEQADRSETYDGPAQQKLPYQYNLQQQQPPGVPGYSGPPTPPFSAVSYGSYYPPPPPSASPQPMSGNDTPYSDGTSVYHDHLQAYLQPQQPHPVRVDGRSPVELPTTHEQDESPLPQYKDSRFSWAGAEAEYRPSKER